MSIIKTISDTLDDYGSARVIAAVFRLGLGNQLASPASANVYIPPYIVRSVVGNRSDSGPSTLSEVEEHATASHRVAGRLEDGPTRSFD